MVSPIGLTGSSRPQPRSVQSPKFGNTPPTAQAISDMTKDLKTRVDQLSGELSKKTGFTPPNRTPEQEATFQKGLKSAATIILKKQNSTPKPVSDTLYTDENGVSHRTAPALETGNEQKRFFESVAQTVFNQNIKPQFDEAQRQKDETLKQQEKAYQKTYRYKLSQMAQSLYGSALTGVAKLASFVAPLPNEAATNTPQKPGADTAKKPATAGETKPNTETKTDPVTTFLNAEVLKLSKQKNITLPALTKEQAATYQHALNLAKYFLNNGVDQSAIVEHLLKAWQDLTSSATAAEAPAAPTGEGKATQTGVTAAAAPQSPTTDGQAASTPQGTPENGGTATPTSGEQTVQGATAPQAADGETKSETTKPADDKKETNADKKEEQNWKNGYIGWKAGIGAALLAGGIALKMTIIGIVPGLIMAGVGTALMGWGGINWLSKDKKD